MELRQLAVAGLAFVPVRDLPESFDTQVVIAWVERKAPTLVAELVAMIRRLSETAGEEGAQPISGRQHGLR